MNKLISKEEEADLTELVAEAKAAGLVPEKIKALIWIIRGMRIGEAVDGYRLATESTEWQQAELVAM